MYSFKQSKLAAQKVFTDHPQTSMRDATSNEYLSNSADNLFKV